MRQRRFNITDWLLFAIMLTVAAVVLGLQNQVFGFRLGHHGWVSSHGLAIISHAELENGFVGYSIAFSDRPDPGQFEYHYFDRYPVFFSAAMNRLLSVTDNLPTQVYIARQAMNVIFLATMFAAFLLLNRLLRRRFVALTAVLLGFSSAHLLYYKDMIHFDQPALLGMFLLLYAIAVYHQDGKRRQLYILALVAIALGRGFASYSVLGLWMVVEAGLQLRDTEQSWAARLRGAITHDATRVFVLAVAWGGSLLFYNIAMEARIRDAPLAETTIIDSAMRRLPVGSETVQNAERTAPLAWRDFIPTQAERIVGWVLPLQYPVREDFTAPYPPLTAALSLGMLAMVGVFIARRPENRTIWFLLAASGIFWIVFMRRLSFEHDYVTMYSVGFGLVVFAALLTWRRSIPVSVVLVLALGLFVASNVIVNREHERIAPQVNPYTEDFNRIAQRIEGEGRSVHPWYNRRCIVIGSCYVMGFYLDEHYLSGFEAADYVVSRYPYHTSEPFITEGEGTYLLANNLTPENEVVFLMDISEAEWRELPEDAHNMFRLGDVFTLQHWRLLDDVTVQPCQTVRVETWWQAETTPTVDYSMVLAMSDANGIGVAETNQGLTNVRTQTWQLAEDGAYYLDARTLTVPCDAAPGAYPMIIGVYDPRTVESLLVYLPDGTPNAAHIYLTTLFVE